MKYELFNMSDFGIPQSRKRVILYGIRKDLKIMCTLSNVEKSSNKMCNMDILKFSLEDALKIENKDILKEIKKGKCLENLNNKDKVSGKPPSNLLKCYNNSNISFRTRNSPIHSCIIDFTDVSRTILCSYGRIPRLFVPVRNYNGTYLRPYTVRELQLIQSFPVNFEFTGSYTEKVKQIGNAIPPTFVNHIVSYISDILKGDILEF
jgi:DNA (cytosine-5)-methyltransferase 1